jgi:hypothetical protein
LCVLFERLPQRRLRPLKLTVLHRQRLGSVLQVVNARLPRSRQHHALTFVCFSALRSASIAASEHLTVRDRDHECVEGDAFV